MLFTWLPESSIITFTAVNNWAVSIEDYQLKFEYIKGVKNTLADTMSRLVQLDPDMALPPEPDGQQFGKPLQGELKETQTMTTLKNR